MTAFLTRLLLFSACVFAVAELTFRTALPASNFPYAIQEPLYSVQLFDTSSNRTGVNSVGRLAANRTRWRVNNYGWISDVDYHPEEDKPTVVVIGDSYIQGMTVNWEDHMASSLNRLMGEDWHVYSLGAGGATASQYINVARYATHHFDPEVFVFFLNSGDIFLSVKNYGSMPLSLSMQYEYARGGTIVKFRHTPIKPIV